MTVVFGSLSAVGLIVTSINIVLADVWKMTVSGMYFITACTHCKSVIIFQERNFCLES